MPFTEIVIPCLQAGLEVKATFAAQWPTASKILASQPGMIRGYFGSIVSENEISTQEEENKPVLVMEWTEEAAFHAFLASEDFLAFFGPFKPLAAGPPLVQIFATNVGPSDTVSVPITEIVRIKLEEDAESTAVTSDSWTGLVKAVGSDVPTSCGTSLNLEHKVFLGAIGWESLEVRSSALEASSASIALSKLRDAGEFSSMLIKVEPFKTA